MAVAVAMAEVVPEPDDRRIGSGGGGGHGEAGGEGRRGLVVIGDRGDAAEGVHGTGAARSGAAAARGFTIEEGGGMRRRRTPAANGRGTADQSRIDI